MKRILCIGALAASLGYYLSHKSPEPKGMAYFYMAPDAGKLVSDGLKRMKDSGAHYTSEQMYAMMSIAAGADGRVDLSEARELCDVVLNPESALGRLARPYSPANGSPPACVISERWKDLAARLMETNGDGMLSENEVQYGIDKIHGRLK